MNIHFDNEKRPTRLQLVRKILVCTLILAIIIPAWVLPKTTRADFADRCNAQWVVLCTGFDTINQVDSFVYGTDDGNFLATYNEDQKTSGTGSMRIEIPSLSSANSSGGYERIINENTNGFVPGDTFYTQYRQRFDTNMLNAIMGGSGWKQVELTTTYGAYVDAVGIGVFNQNLDNAVKLYIGSTVQTPNQTINYVPEQWMTFYYKVVIGEWGTPTSQVSVWVGLDNQALVSIYSVDNLVLSENTNDPSSGYNKVIISPRNNGKLNTVEHPNAYTWYDELIVSTNPIADPWTDNQAPTIPQGLTGAVISATEINLTWTGSTDNVAVSGYKIFRDGVLISSTIQTSFSDTGLTPQTQYSYTVLAYDSNGNSSVQSPAVVVVTPASVVIPPPDTENPTAPTNLTGTAESTSEIKLTWTGSTDNVAVTTYKVFRNNSELTSTSNLNFTDVNLSASTTYKYTVKAQDEAGNISDDSNEVSVTTQNQPSSGGGGGGGSGIAMPVIYLFSASQPNINSGNNITLQWTVFNTSDVVIDQGVGPVSPYGSKTLNLDKSTVFTLTARNILGPVTKSIAVNVGNVANSQTYSDGTLLLDKGTIYIMEYAVKRPFVSMPVFLSYGYKIENVKSADTTGIAQGGPIVNSMWRHTRGTVVVDKTGTVWFLGTEYRYAFPSGPVFLSWGHKYSDIVPANAADLLIPIGPIVTTK